MQSKRGDIQVFRALSVVVVFLFHSEFGFPNGYLGVDIFFALSGFVIWGLLDRLLKEDNYPLRTFYTGRVRRIMPAASTVVIVVSLVQVSFGATQATLGSLTAGIYALFSFANIEIARQVSDYFAPEATSSPFLHMWSLGIEEQFYLMLPIAIFLLHSFESTRKRIPSFVLLISTFSLCVEFFATITGNNSVMVGYYSPLPRIWEFGVGILSYLYLRRVIRKTYQFLISVFVIVVLMWIPAQGIYLLLIKLALLALIAALLSSPTELGGSVLSRCFVWLGDRSYSFYLWHWPCILIYRNFSWNPVLTLIAMFGSTIILANISYLYIEQPIRKKIRFPQLNRVVITFLVLPTLILTFFYGSIHSQLNFKNSIKSIGIVKGDVGQKDFHRYIYQKFETCVETDYLNEIPKYDGRPQCAITNRSANPSVILLGDSHSEHLFPGLAGQLKNINVQYIDTGGLPIINSDTNKEIFKYINNVSSEKVIILSAFWSNRGVPETLTTAIKSLNQKNVSILLVSDNPSFSLNPLDCKFSNKKDYESLCIEKLPRSTSEIEAVKELIDISSKNKVKFLNIRDLFCSYEDECSMIREDKLLFRDNNHLGIYGSHLVGKRLAPLVIRELSLLEK